MELKAITKLIKQRRALILPLLMLPFLAMLYWVFFGNNAKQEPEQKKSAINKALPDAKAADRNAMDKMGYYKQAQLDSLRFEELMKADPNLGTYGTPGPNGYPPGNENIAPYDNRTGINTSIYGTGRYNDPSTEQVYRRLADLDREMRSPLHNGARMDNYSQDYPGVASNHTSDVDRLEQMMYSMEQPPEEDPEMKQINGMLENILDIQNPDRAREKLKQQSASRRGQVFAVTTSAKQAPVSLIRPGTGTSSVGFYSLEDQPIDSLTANAIKAVVHETQTIVNGSIVKMRLVTDVYISGVLIPKDNFIYGIAALEGERLNITINSIRYGNSLFPVELAVYDMDGVDGVYIPGAISRDVAKQSASQSIQGIGLGALDPSWGAQAASAGIEVAKSFFNRKAKLIKVVVKAGYQVLLRDEKQKQSLTR